MKILVTGGRDFHDNDFVYKVLDSILRDNTVTHIIHGNAGGCDQIAGSWARAKGIQEVVCPADWKYHGNSAGPIRNKRMLELVAQGPGPTPVAVDRVIAFPGHRGTSHMIGIANTAGVFVEYHAPD